MPTCTTEAPSILFPIATLLVALSSLALSIFSYLRDRGRLELYIGLGDILDAKTLKKEQTIINITVTNVGRRPVIIRGLAGDHRGNWWRKLIYKVYPDVPECLFPKGTFYDGENIKPLIFDANNKHHVLTEGQIVNTHIPIVASQNHSNWSKLFAENVNLYVFDTANRNYYVPRMIYRKFLNDLKKISDK